MHAGDVYRPAYVPAPDGFSLVDRAVIDFATPLDIDGIVDLARTRSYWRGRMRRHGRGSSPICAATSPRSTRSTVPSTCRTCAWPMCSNRCGPDRRGRTSCDPAGRVRD